LFSGYDSAITLLLNDSTAMTLLLVDAKTLKMQNWKLTDKTRRFLKIFVVDRVFNPRDVMLGKVLAVVFCLIVSKRLHGSSWLFAYGFPSTHSTPYFHEITISRKIRLLLSGTLSQTLDFENLATARCRRQV